MTTTRLITYSPETIAAYGKVIDVGLHGNEDDVTVALRHLMMMVHCDMTGELRLPHTHDENVGSEALRKFAGEVFRNYGKTTPPLEPPLQSAENVSEGAGHFLGGGPDRNTCPKCGSKRMEVRNHSLMWHDGQVHCADCGEYVREFDAG